MYRLTPARAVGYAVILAAILALPYTTGEFRVTL